MSNKPTVFQFKVTLQDVKPAVWRRIQTPSRYSFWDLHVAIQDAMGWRDAHLHEFHILDPARGEMTSIGIPDDGEFGDAQEVAHSREHSISDYWSAKNPSARYVYDFGDDWIHEIVLEEAVSWNGVSRPVCLDGKGACPPEDCGGPFGYAEFLRHIKKPGSVRGGELLEWVGGSFDPHGFELDNVVFDDPEARWAWTFSESVQLEQERILMTETPRKPDRQGRVAYQIPLVQRDMILKQCAGLVPVIEEQFHAVVVKNGSAAVKLDEDELKALGGCLATVSKNARPGLDRRIFLALRSHFSAMESLLRGI